MIMWMLDNNVWWWCIYSSMSEMAVITVNSVKLLLPACNLHSFAISSSPAGQSLRWSMAQELYHYGVHVRTSIAFMSHSSHIHKTTTAETHTTCVSGVQQNKTLWGGQLDSIWIIADLCFSQPLFVSKIHLKILNSLPINILLLVPHKIKKASQAFKWTFGVLTRHPLKEYKLMSTFKKFCHLDVVCHDSGCLATQTTKQFSNNRKNMLMVILHG